MLTLNQTTLGFDIPIAIPCSYISWIHTSCILASHDKISENLTRCGEILSAEWRGSHATKQSRNQIQLFPCNALAFIMSVPCHTFGIRVNSASHIANPTQGEDISRLHGIPNHSPKRHSDRYNRSHKIVFYQLRGYVSYHLRSERNLPFPISWDASRSSSRP